MQPGLRIGKSSIPPELHPLNNPECRGRIEMAYLEIKRYAADLEDTAAGLQEVIREAEKDFGMS